MGRIRSNETKPELMVRRLAHRMGYRFRLHRKDLPGKPDLVFAGRRCAVFVHGCFWHQHPGCREGRTPASNRDYWEPKLKRNVKRDASVAQALRSEGWQVLVVWECDCGRLDELADALRRFLGPPGSSPKRRQTTRQSGPAT